MASKKNDKNKKKKSSFLTTNQWLGESPPPSKEPDKVEDASQSTDAMPRPDLDAIGGPQPVDAHGSMIPLGREQGDVVTPSSVIMARDDLAELTASMPIPAAEDDDEAIDLATPPGGATTGPPSLSKILKATGTKSDILRGVKAHDSGSGLSFVGPASGWLSGKFPPAPKTGGSRTDIGAPARSGDDASDIFSSARPGAMQPPPSGTGTNLPGMSGIGRSSIFNEPSRAGSSGASGIGMGAESDLFAGLTSTDRGSSLYDDTAKRTQKMPPPKPESLQPVNDDSDDSESVHLMGDEFDDSTELDARPLHSGPTSSARLADRLLAGLADSGNMGMPDFNTLDKTASGSNLFDDVTALDIDLGSEAGQSGTSGLNWLDPNRSTIGGNQDSGPNSSIFLKAQSSDEPSNPGHVDFSEIPLMGSTDDPEHQVQNSELAGPASSVFKTEIDKTMKELKAGRGAISFDLPSGSGDDGRIAWGVPESRLADQASMRMPLEDDDELDLESPGTLLSGVNVNRAKPRKDSDSVFDDTLDLPDESGILMKRSASMSGSILKGMTDQDLRNAQYDNAAPAPQPRRTKSPSSREFDLETKTSPRKSRGLALGALGLLLGAGAGIAGMTFLGPKPTAPTPVAVAPVKPDNATTFTTAEAARFLASGDPTMANVAYQAITEKSPAISAGRGQARWMARLRDVAGRDGKLAATDAEIVAAREDLQKVVNQIETLTSPEDQKAGLRAALNLGLILESTNNPGDAITLYTSMSEKLPAYKQVFDSAKQRVTLMRKGVNGVPVPDDKYSLGAADLMNLAQANLILLSFDAVQAIDDEPGFHFWDAINASTQRSVPGAFDNAIASINKAKSAHEARRQKLIGLGLNPLSDPTEQMFLRACDELAVYFKIKKRIYDDPLGQTLAKGDGTGRSSEQVVIELINGAQRAVAADAKIASLTKAADDAAKLAMTAKDDAAAAKIAKETAEKAVETLKADVAEKSKAIDDVRAASEAAVAKLKVADAAIDPLIAQLKAAKVIDDKATREQAIVALPEAAKKAVLLGGSGETATMAKELAALKEKAQADLAEAAKKQAALEATLKAAEETTKTAIAKAQADAAIKQQTLAEKLAIAEQALRKEQAAAEVKLAEQAKAYQEQILAVRAGAMVAFSDGERDAIDQATRAYGLGVEAYQNNRVGEAETFLTTAVTKNPNDARYWYYLGLAKLRQGRDAKDDFQKGAALESKGLPRAATISSELSAVQGYARSALDAARP